MFKYLGKVVILLLLLLLFNGLVNNFCYIVNFKENGIVIFFKGN